MSGLQALVRAQAERTPDAVAVAAGREAVTFAELVRRAGRLAAVLRGAGVGPEDRVGVFLTRTATLPAALLGILESGAAYVPLDPTYPAERLAYMAEDSGLRVLVTETALARRLPEGLAGRATVLADRLAGAGGEPPAAEGEPAPDAGPGRLAYVIYTSGSTGAPKGVGIEHRSAVAFLEWARTAISPEERRGVLFTTSVCFDVSVFELFLPLSWGGTLLVAGSEFELLLPRLASVATLVSTVPSVAAELLRQAPLPPAVRTVCLAGEALPRSVADALYAQPGVERVLNLYGPTEDTTYSTWAEAEREGAAPPSIGVAIAGSQARVADEGLEAVPDGAVGELFLGGAGLARGYLGRPGLTAERFVPDPFGGAPGGRLYRTGDRVRLEADGRLSFLGRLDHQVKIHGLRIELGEVEAALDRLPEVAAGVVLAKELAPGSPALVAYVVPNDPAAASAEVLRRGLARSLPDYMVPQRFLFLDAFPRTPSGKVDRKALPEPAREGPKGGAPRTELEGRLAGLWEELLGVAGIGPEDDFLALGGHSLLAARMLFRVEEALGRRVALAAFLQARTLSALARLAGDGEGSAPAAAEPPLVPVQEGAAAAGGARELPPSFAQQRLWLLDRMVPGSPLYTIAWAQALDGPVDAAALAADLGALAARHEALRTTFPERNDGPVQRIAPPGPVALPVADLSRLPGAARAAEAPRVGAAFARRPFDLARGPLLRALLLRRGGGGTEGVHRLLVAVHHAVFDGWSERVFTAELAALRRARAAGRPARLPPLPLQYADFAAWQRRWLAGPVLEAEIEHWRRELAGAPDALELPTDRPRPAVPSHRGSRRSLELPAAVADGVRSLARQEGATSFMVLLAAFAALLGRWSGRDDLLVGTPAANRRRPELQGLIGFFVNTLAIRADLAGDPTVRELLGRVRERALAAYAHEDLPFERLVEALRPERERSRNPLVQGVLSLDDGPVGHEEIATGTAKFDLLMEARLGDGGLRLEAEYARDLFDGATVRRLLEGLGRLLDAAMAEPGRRVSELPLLSPAACHQVTVEWARPPAEAPPGAADAPSLDAPVHARFAEVARRRPDAVALAAGPRQLTYGALARRAGHLARELRRLGVGPETPVALALERSPELVVAILGVLGAGGFYLPLDPTFPEERIALLLEDLAAPVVVTTREVAERLPLPAAAARTVLVDGLGGPGGAAPEAPGADDAGSNAAAYVMYTSGSTGRPKGVVVPHRAVLRLVRGPARSAGGGGGFARFAPDETFLLLAPAAFDASTLELWGPLLHGGRLAVAPPGPTSPAELGAAVEAERVTALWLTAGLFHQVVEAGLEGLGGLRRLLAGGDVLSPEHCRRALAALPGTVLVNGYGPTENTTFTCCHPMAGPAEVPSPVPVGRPIPHTTVQVADRHLRPVPPGVPGELLAGGAGLARGYAGRPAWTAERFVPDPFADEPGARLYRTGDLARFRPGGELEFLGRLDQQVKIRGFRVEPGEVEAVLAAHPEVAGAAVVARQDPAGGRRLVAYAVPSGDGTAGDLPARLRAHLAARLPEALVPAAVVLLPALPLGATGKVDRRALPEPRWEAAGAGGEETPAGPVEGVVAALWEEVLGLEAGSVGRQGRFFDLGGHSLAAARVVARLRGALGVELPLSALFDAPTVAGLAARAEEALAGGRAPLPPLQAAERPPGAASAPLSFSQERLWFLDRYEPDSPVYNVPVAWAVDGPLDAPALRAALAAVVRRHEVLRTAYAESADGPRQMVHPEARVRLPVVDLSALPGPVRAAEAAAAALARRPFDLARGPVLRAALLRLGATEHRLVLVVHHIATDGWSLGVFLEELAAGYGATLEGGPPSLPALPVQYADFARWQRGWLRGELLAEQLAYWTGRLAGLEPLELPADRPRPAVQSVRGALRRLALPAAAGPAAEALGRREGATPFMTGLAAFAALVARLAGRDDLAVGTPVANRRSAELEGLIGFFVNTLVLRIDLGGAPTFRELVARVRRAAVEAYVHQDVPFERLVEALGVERDRSRSPLFEVFFAHQGEERARRLGEARLAELPVDSGTAKFDLSLFVAGVGGAVEATAEYASDLFDATTVDRLLRAFATLLAAAAADPDRPVAALPLLGGAERHHLLAEWAAEPGDPPPPACLHELFRAQAERTPGAEALIAGTERLTYRELAARAARLAERLRALGVGPEDRVAVAAGRGARLVVALLGVLEAGGAYVPLDPAYPRKRLEWMLEDSGAVAVLTEAALAPALPEHRAATVLLDDEAAWAGAAAGPALPPVAVTPANLAYLIYTSGSTGRPKAVAIEHRQAAALVAWARRAFTDGELSGVAAATSISFDLSVFEIFVPLACGGRVILADDALAVPDLPAAGEVTLLDTVPSAMEALVRAGRVPPSVRTVNLAGEPLSRDLARRVTALPGVRRLLDLYGPSEDTTYSTVGAWDPSGPSGSRAPAIGRPVTGTRAHLLDPAFAPVPPGVPGELLLGGAGLARGYLDRPGLTAERFVPDPFAGPGGGPPGGRLYRTGDLARWLPDGRLDFLGRLDHQVKIRGFRIEPREVESVLARLPSVAEAVVVPRPDPELGLRLVAYVAGTGGEAPAVEALRSHLEARLPAYMVPGAFVVLPALPRTPNGKLDRRALPEPGREVGGEADRVAPRGPWEELVAEVWAGLLGLGREGVGARDDFFRTGGHSLAAARLVTRLREATGVDLPVRQVFDTPTVAGLALVLARQRAGGAPEADRLQPLAPGPRPARPPLSFGQERLWFLHRLDPGDPTFNIPFPHRLTGPLLPALLARSLAAVARRHEVLRTTFAAEGGRPYQVVGPPGPVPLPVADLSGLPGWAAAAEALRLAREEGRRPFDLARGPVLRAALVRLPAEPAGPRHLLLLTLHHAAADGWSLDVLREELVALYGAGGDPERAGLAPPPVQYADHAVWQRRRMEAGVLEEELDLWRRRLAGVPRELALPGPAPDGVRGGRRRGGLARRALPVELAAGVRELVRGAGGAGGRAGAATPFMAVLAAFEALLGAVSGQERFTLGTPVANRDRREVEGLIGFFVDTVVLRADLRGDPSFRDLLARCREETLSAFAHAVPFERLVAAVRPERGPERGGRAGGGDASALFRAMVALERLPPEPERRAGELAVEPLSIHTDTAQFDLTLYMVDREEELEALLEYDRDRVGEAVAGALLEGFETVLARAVGAPDRPLSELVRDLPAPAAVAGREDAAAEPVRPPAAHGGEDRSARLAARRARLGTERRAMLEARLRTVARRAPGGDEAPPAAAPGPARRAPGAAVVPLPARLGEHAEARPDAVALVCGDTHLSYRELRRRVARLARRMGAHRVGPEVLVGVSLERSPGLVVSILAVLEAGGAYLPLDPSYPAERLALMLEDSGAGLLVAEEGAADGALAGDRLRRIASGSPEVEAGEPRASSGGGAAPEHLAYVIYTSGSTGRPKGVLVEHRCLANLAEAQVETFGVCPGDRILQFAPASFDASVFELAMALWPGATLVLAPAGELLPGSGLGPLLARQRITHLTLPPSVLAALPEGDLPGLATLVSAGEALPGELAARWQEGRRLWNAYGPTETTVWATAGRYRPGEARPPIGRAIPGLRVAVTGPDLRPVPAGDSGELVVGGAGLARGYLGRPALTAERFVPDPLGPTAGAAPGGRLYRTGDLARELPDGRLDFLGRADHQVKIRGHRVEPGEVEAVLGAHPAVRAAAVVARPGPSGEPRLLAYAVAPDAAASELRAYLASRLPRYLVPAALVRLEEMPLLPSGKVDRGALPEPVLSAGADRDGDAPRTGTEATLAAIWRELLGVGGPAPEDDFFELGGHSLAVGRLVARVRRDLGVELAPGAVFEGRTLAAVARAVEKASEPPLPPVERAPRDRPLPLTFPQERVWFLEELAPGNVAYHAVATVRLEGPLRPPALRAALAELVRRHEVFRSRFFAVDGRPWQEPLDRVPVALPVIDLRTLPPGRREGEVARLARREGRRPFDLGRPPLVRWRLLLEDESVATLLQVEHHMAHDGWAFAVLMDELRRLYTAFAAGLPSPLPNPPAQIGDLAAWQRRVVAGERLRRLLGYWTGRLAGAPPALELPADRPRPPAPTFRGEAARIELPPELARALREAARASGSTLFAVMLAGFQALLARYTGEDDVVVGSGMANRRTAEAEGAIGMVVNTLALRTSLGADRSAGPGFRQLLARVGATLLGAQAHQDVPLDRLIEALRLPRDPSRDPLFQVLFSFHDSGVPDLDLGEVRGRVLERHNGSAKADLNVVVIPRAEQRLGRWGRTWEGAADDAVTLIWEWSSDLFDRSTMLRMVGHYRSLLAAALAAPERPVAALPMLSRPERAQLVTAWNDTSVAYPREGSIPELFARVAAARPEAVALRQGERWWTYGELARRARRVAAGLRSLGMGPEALVGLAAGRSPETVAALLGILEAGAAYLPLDPEEPPERLAFQLEDGAARLVLAEEGALARLPAETPTRAAPRIVSLEAPPEAGPPAAAPSPGPPGPSHLAYVLYTSGSTGRPKGVAVAHRSVVRLVRGQDYAALGPDEVLLQLAPLSFDASTLEIWGALLNGGRLEILPPGTPSSGELGREVERSRVTTLWLTAGLFHQTVEAELPRLAGVRQLLAGGDVLSPAGVARVRAVLPPGHVLVNGYGPTEGTTFTCCYRMAPAAAGEGASGRAPVPVGRPISNTRVHLVEAAPGRGLDPAPVGVPGELWAGGDGVARGYRARPGLTAAAFVPDPFSGEAGGRLYRTGDLARRLPDGRIEFLRRIDRQVKLRGFRIELGEIETALAAHPAVAQATVDVRGAGAGGKRLVAWVVPAPGAPAGKGLGAELRRHLAERLPDYMVPRAFAVLDALPVGATGKVDRRALPQPAAPPPGAGGGGPEGAGGPATPLEETLRGVWEELLGVERAGLRDDFFELGGHSLLAMRLVSRVRDLLGVELPLRRLFEAPTVAGMAAAVAEALAGGRGAPLPPPVEPIADPPLRARPPLSFAQERLWFLDRLDPGGTGYTVSVPLDLRGGLDPGALARSLAALAARHEVLRTRYPEEDGRPYQRVEAPPPPALPVADLSGLPAKRREAEAARLRARESRRPFDLARGPVARWTLLRLGPAGHHLLLTVHHVAFDGWSLGVLLPELGALYRGFAAGTDDPAGALPPLPVRYAEYAVWQRRWLAGEVLDAHLSWWRERLAGPLPRLELPADRPRPAVESPRGAVTSRALPRDLDRRLAVVGRRHGASLYMVLLAAFDAVLHRYTGEADLLVGTPEANRGRAEVEGLIGFFTNTLVVRADLSGDPPFGEALARVREAVLGAFTHAELPFETLVEALDPERSLAATPLFQVLMAFLTGPEAERRLRWGDLDVRRLTSHNAAAKLDLSLYLEAGSEGLRAAVEYRTDLFDRCTAERLLGHYGRLLEAAVEAPETRLSELPLLTPPERQQLAVDWAEGPGVVAPPACLHELVRAQAALTPEATALVAGPERLSYRELTARAGRLAHRLRALGVGPEARVAVFAGRSSGLVVGLLAVLEAGGAYVPLDPAYPAERLAFMLEDSGAVAVLADSALAAALPPQPGTRVLLDDEASWTPSPGEAAGGPGRRARPENLAYVIYTSGSSGRPKGVAIEHRSACALVRWAREAFSDEELAGVAAVTSASFDLSVFELFVPLSWGGRVVLAEDALALPGLPSAGEVTLLDTVPSAMDALLRAGGVPPSVRTVNLAGEPLSRELAERVAALPDSPRLLDLYGPSEDTTYSTWAPASPGSGAAGGSPAIGRPVTGTRARVVDRRLAPAPAGVPGELVLGGAGLARGYLGRPGRTALSFVPDPLAGRAAEAGARLYTTGDRARWLPDGRLDFLGRLDQQVKIRGFRVEPGEVEARLLAHPAVAEAAVAAWRPDGGVPLLAAWVAADGEGGAAPPGEALEEELRRHLGRCLPAHMVPSVFVLLPALPRTPNGKLDRRALPEPHRPVAPAAAGPAPEAATPFEDVVADAWSEALGRRREEIGLHDDFFRLGGHSLLAARVVSRLRDATGVELPLGRVFESPTVAGLAADLARALAGDGPEPAGAEPPLTAAGRPERPPLSFGQERLWFLDRLEPGDPTFNLPLLMRLDGPLAPARLARALAAVARRHESLRTRFAAADGAPFQAVAAPGPVPLPVLDLSALPADAAAAEARRRPREEARRPFDLARGPLFRAVLVRLGAETQGGEGGRHLLLQTLHHAVADAASLEVLLGELAALYGADGDPVRAGLPPLPVQYADYASWQRRRLTEEALDRRVERARRRLDGTCRSLALPADGGGSRRSRGGASLRRELPGEAAGAVRGLERRVGATPFMVGVAAVEALLHAVAGRDDFTLGTPVARRERRELEGLIGFFVDTAVLRARLAGDPSFVELVARCREDTLQALAAPPPFERLVGALLPGRGPHRDGEASPLFRAMAVYHRLPERREREAGGVRFAPLYLHTGTAQFDLTFSLVESGTGSALHLEYDAALFREETARRLLDGWAEILTRAAAGPDRPLSELVRGLDRTAAVAEAADAGAAESPGEDRADRLAARRARLSGAQREALEARLRDAARSTGGAGASGGGGPAPAGPGEARCLVPLRPGGDGAPLFLVHPAGGDVLCFQALARHLAPGRPVHGLQSAGLTEGVAPDATFEVMAERYAAAVRRARPEGPVHLAGWSLGGGLAFEAARRLEAGGVRVGLLGVIDTVPRLADLHLPELDPEADLDDARWLMHVVEYAEGLSGRALGLGYEELRGLPPEAGLRRLGAALAGAGLLAPGAGERYLERLLEVFKTNCRAAGSYRPRPYGGPVVLFRAADGAPDRTADGAPAGGAAEPDLGWGRYAARPVAVETVPGTHVTLLAEPAVRELAARLDGWLARLEGAPRPVTEVTEEAS